MSGLVEVGKGADLEDSNCAGLGGDEDRAARKAAAMSDPDWAGAGTKVGVEVWRVENQKARRSGLKADFGINRWPEKDYGMFYDGDSYIVLQTRKKKDETGAEVDGFEWDAFFWLGQDSTQDEMGVAAYKTVEIDTILDDGPVQYREVQNFESDKFVKLWKNRKGGMQVLDGGIDGGFNKAEPEAYAPRLFRMTKSAGSKGYARVKQVPLSWDSLCKSDCFLLDLGMKLYPFRPDSAAGAEERKMREFMRQLDEDRDSKPEQLPDNDKDFFAFFEKTRADAADLPENAPEVVQPVRLEAPKLFRLSLDGDGQDGFALVQEGGLTKDLLTSEDAYIIDSGDCIFAWCGNAANAKERREIMVKAQNYLLADASRSKGTPITRLWEGQSTAAFNTCFQ